MHRKYLISFVFLIVIFSSNSALSMVINNNIVIKEENTSIIPENIGECSNFDIVHPSSSNPVIVESGKNFTINYNMYEYENIYFYISTAYEPVVDEFQLNIINIWNEEDIYYAKLNIPISVPEELYNLTVVILKNDKFYYKSEPRAVSIVEKIDETFTFIHLADFHVGDVRGFAESIYETLKSRSIKKCIEEVNLLHPDFVIISGDLVFGQLYPFEYRVEYKKCYELIQMFDVPTYLVPGNHDGYRRLTEDGLEFWKKYFGSYYYSFNYGDYYFQAINSYDWPAIYRTCIGPIALTWGGYIQDKQLSWIENDLEENKNSKLKFMFMHHNPIWDTKRDTLINRGYNNREQLLSLIDRYNINMVLAGHVHFDNVTIHNDTIFLTTTTPESEIRFKDGYWGYRIVEIKDGNIISYNYKEPKYSVPSYKINVDYKSIYSAEVKNDLETDINVLLKFTVPKREYIIKNGVILSTRENIIKREYYISANIRKESKKEINLYYIS